MITRTSGSWYKLLQNLTPLLLSLALFAFWLRSSVVSVLFSLISEIPLRGKSMIKIIFVTCEGSSGLAYDFSHCVPGLTLPLGDANIFFTNCLRSTEALEKNKRLFS